MTTEDLYQLYAEILIKIILNFSLGLYETKITSTQYHLNAEYKQQNKLSCINELRLQKHCFFVDAYHFKLFLFLFFHSPNYNTIHTPESTTCPLNYVKHIQMQISRHSQLFQLPETLAQFSPVISTSTNPRLKLPQIDSTVNYDWRSILTLRRHVHQYHSKLVT